MVSSRYTAITRRAFSKGAVAAGAAAIANPPALGQVRLLANDKTFLSIVQDKFVQPNVSRSVNGKLSATLRVAYAKNSIGRDEVHLRSYNQQLVGPTLRVRPGDVMEIRLENHLPWKESAHGHGHGSHNSFGYNATNLHTHGLHVSPAGRSDNVLITVLPSGAPKALEGPMTHVGAFDYRIEIPANHLPGTHWYHAHLHGSTAIQLASGMAGALIVEGDIDDVPEIRAVPERVFVFQQIPFQVPEGGGPGIIEDERLEDLIDRFSGSEDRKRFTTINGIVPVIRIKKGAVERWRFIDGGIFELLSLDAIGCSMPYDPAASSIAQFCPAAESLPSSAGIEFYPIARDGLTLGTLEKFQGRALPTLAPGNRLDILVKPTQEGTYILRKRELEADVLNAFVRFNMLVMSGMRIQDAANAVRDEPYAVAIIVVEPGTVNVPLPPEAVLKSLKRPAIIDSAAATTHHSIQFELKPGHPGHPSSIGYVGSRTFEHDMFPRTLQLGDIDKWTIGALREPHPFHIHVNPLQLAEIGGVAVPPLGLDVALVWPNKPISFVTRYEDFVGKFVLHCHNLVHEDLGMMELVEIVPRATGALTDLKYYQWDQAPGDAWSFLDEAGKPLGRPELLGKVVLLNLWDPACAGCADELKRIQSLQATLGTTLFVAAAVAQGADVLAVKAYFARHGIAKLGIYVDPSSSLSAHFKTTARPASILVDRAGHPRAWLHAAARWDSAEAEALVRYFLDN